MSSYKLLLSRSLKILKKLKNALYLRQEEHKLWRLIKSETY